MKSSKRNICQAVLLAFAVSGSIAHAATVQGGGSTLVQPTINSEITQSAQSIQYFGVGSGAGLTGFLGNVPSSLGTTGTVDFANSDSPLTASQVSTTGSYTLSSADGPLIQLPYVVTPITIPVVNAPAGVASPVVLNDADLCGIFSGKITTWSGVINPSTGVSYTSSTAPISVVYRSDSSGTTDLLTRHLQAVCTTGTGGNSSVAFTETGTFANEFGGVANVPSNFIAESGSSGVAAELVSLKSPGTAAFGYLSPDYTNSTLAPSSVNATNNLAVASLFNSNNSTTYVPTFANATAALNSNAIIAAPSGSAEANPFNWVPGAVTPVSGSPAPAIWTAIANPVSGYPISGTSNIVVSQCYKALAKRNIMHTFLNDHYNNATFASIVNGNGFDVVPASYKSAILADILANTNNLNLDLDDTTVCGAAGSGLGR